MSEQIFALESNQLLFDSEVEKDPVTETPVGGFADFDVPITMPVSPELRLKKEKEKVIIEFEKTIYDGIMLYGRRNTEDNYSLLSVVSKSPYIDARPNQYQAPELREYRACFIKNKKTIGCASEFKIIVKK